MRAGNALSPRLEFQGIKSLPMEIWGHLDPVFFVPNSLAPKILGLDPIGGGIGGDFSLGLIPAPDRVHPRNNGKIDPGEYFHKSQQYIKFGHLF